MTIHTTQKVIKVGSSLAVTIPAKDVKQLNIQAGDMVETTIKPTKTTVSPTIAHEYELFKKQYGNTLKNLADR